MKIVLYSTNCPKCEVLEKKLSAANIDYTLVTDVKLMRDKGFMTAPMLEVDEALMDFKPAVEWVNKVIGDK